MTLINSRRRALLALGTGALLAGKVIDARADDIYRIIVPFPTGGSTDNLARLVANWMTDAGHQVIVENRPGAAGAIGVRALLQMPADGKTLLFTPSSPVTMNPFLVKDLPYDPLKDLEPVARLFRSSSIMVSNATGPYRTVSDLIEASNQGTPISFASATTGYTLVFTHIAKTVGIKAVVANYRGGTQAIVDVAGGVADFAFTEPLLAYKLIEQKKVHPLAVFGETRDPSLPDTPTSLEAGLGLPALYPWTSAFVKSGTPPEAVARLADLLKAATQSPAMIAAAEQMALYPHWGDAAETRKLMRSEMAIVAQLTKEAGLEPQ